MRIPRRAAPTSQGLSRPDGHRLPVKVIRWAVPRQQVMLFLMGGIVCLVHFAPLSLAQLKSLPVVGKAGKYHSVFAAPCRGPVVPSIRMALPPCPMWSVGVG